MIKGEDIERAERILQITYQNAEHMPAQLRGFDVDSDAFAQWLGHRKQSAMKHYWRSYKAMDPRIEAAFNTLLMHFFIVGVVCGRDDKVGMGA